MPEGSARLPLNPVPRSLLDQFLQELHELGLTERQVEGHLVFLRLWQKYLAPIRLLEAEPEELPGFQLFLEDQHLGAGEIRFAGEAVEHFYAFTLDRHPAWEGRAPWEAYLLEAPPMRTVPLWKAIERKFLPHLRHVDSGSLRWDRP